jgi:exosome complex RNA-binding protein Rrp4
LGKAMINFKGIESFNVTFDTNGRIWIEQYNNDKKDVHQVSFTLEQYEGIDKFIRNNYLDILHSWNSGVESDDE